MDNDVSRTVQHESYTKSKQIHCQIPVWASPVNLWTRALSPSLSPLVDPPGAPESDEFVVTQMG